MYSSGYAKYSPPAKKAMQYHSKGKSCGYYMRIIFFFSSLIQSLIIVSLVLFLIYGKKQDSASVSRIQDLEESFSRLSIDNVALRRQGKNLTTLLNTTVTEKAIIEWNLAKCRYYGNISLMLMPEMEKKTQQCMTELFMCKSMIRTPGTCPPFPGHCNCGPLANELQARLALVEANFTQTTLMMRTEKDQITRERDNLHLEVIRLRRDKVTHEREVQMYRQRCREDFVLSLSGVSNVTRAFLEKIESLFPTHIAFQLTCERQREHLDQIRTNCTSLSREVEDKFQRYLNNVGLQVSTILSENSRLKAENQRLYEDYRWCSHNRTDMIQQHKRDNDLLQQKYDKEKEKILEEKIRLSGDIEVLNSNINYKNKEVIHLKDQLKQLNMSCMARAGHGTFSGLLNSRTGTLGWGSSSPGSTDLGRTGLGLGYNKPASTGTGSSLFGGGSSSSTGSAYNKPASTGTGSSLFGGGSSSSTGSAYNKPASTGTGSSLFGGGSSSSTGSAYNKPASTGTGSSLFGGGSSSSSGSAYNKPASTGTGSSLFGGGSSSSSGSAVNKPASTGTGSSLFGGGSSSSSGSAVNKPASTGTGSSSSSFSGASSSSTGSGLSRLGSTGTGSSSSSLFNSGSSSSTGSALSKSGSTYGSAGSNPSSSGTGLNKPVQTGRGSPTSGSSTGSAGSSSFFGSSSSSSNKPAPNAKTSTGFGSSSTSTAKSSSSSGFGSWLGFGNTNSGQSKTGSGTGKGPSNGNGFGGTGSSIGGGRTNGPGGGPVSIAQHLQELQRFIYPPGPEEKQDLSRLLG